MGMRHVYGPVFSRRLGRSLGLDLVPFKTCTYDCIYCQLGRTTNLTSHREEYVPLDEVLAETERKLTAGPAPEFISLAGSGEPTLHSRIGELIAGIKRMSRIPVAVITNGSLLWQHEVQEELMAADVVMPSLDAGDANLFRLVNRPVKEIEFERMVEGLAGFRRRYAGKVWLEVMVLAGMTGLPREVEKIAELVRVIGPDRVHFNTVSRPPAEEFAEAVSAARMRSLARLLPGEVEVVSENGGVQTGAGEDPEVSDDEILALVSRRPCTVQGVADGLRLHPHQAAKRLERLTRDGRVRPVRRELLTFYESVGEK